MNKTLLKEGTIFIKQLLLIFLFFSSHFVMGQHEKNIRMHSHNDYYQNVPFWKALSCGLSSIEVDVYLQNDQLYVTHSASEIIENRTIEELYLNPIQKMIELKLGDLDALQLLIDIKSDPYSTLLKLISILEQYPKLITNQTFSIVISGNRPQPKEYPDYPDYIHFDYQSLEEIPRGKTWEKVALISLNFRNYSNWNGTGNMTNQDQLKIKELVDKAHQHGKPFRFWGTPDTLESCTVFSALGIDFLNTDDPIGLSTFLKQQKLYH